jgi:hypothetical protein
VAPTRESVCSIADSPQAKFAAQRTDGVRGEITRAQPFSTAPWVTGRAREGDVGDRLFPQGGRRPLVPVEGGGVRPQRFQTDRSIASATTSPGDGRDRAGAQCR